MLNISNMADPSKASFIITVHGTGAGEESDTHPKWWQPNSDFCKYLKGCIDIEIEISPVKWTGYNSEYERRKAGQELLKKIVKVEELGRPYHLIGHSHGGSVIWHALQGSVRNNTQLKNLKSVSTIGTPFMEYRANLSFLLLPLVIAIGAIPIVLSGMLSRSVFDWFLIVRDTDAVSLISFGILMLMYFSLQFGLLRRLKIGLTAWFKTKQMQLMQKQVAQIYGAKIQFFTHEMDEPIAGLMGSTQAGARILMSRPSKGSMTRFSRIKNAITNSFINPANEFAWNTVVRKIQGSDILYEDLMTVRSCPSVLLNSQLKLSAKLSKKMEDSASKHSVLIIRKIRRKLSESAVFQNASDSFDALSSAVSWSAIIHSSYFNFPEFNKLISRHIQSSENISDHSIIGASQLDYLQNGGGRNGPIVTSLSSVIGLGLIGLLYGISSFAIFIDATSFKLLTNQYTVTKIARRFSDVNFIGSGHHPFVAEGYVRSYAMGFVDPNHSTLENIFDENSRLMIEQRLSYAFGYKGDEDELNKLLYATSLKDFYGKDWPQDLRNYRKFLLFSFYIAGTLDRGITPTQRVFKLFRESAKNVILFGTRSRTMVLTLAPRLIEHDSNKYLSIFLSSFSKNLGQCEIAAEAALDFGPTVRGLVLENCQNEISKFNRVLLSEKHDGYASLGPIEQLVEEQRNSWRKKKLVSSSRLWSAISSNVETTQIISSINNASSEWDHFGALAILSCNLARQGNYKYASLAAERAGPMNSRIETSQNYAGVHGGYVAILTEYLDKNPFPLADELGLLRPGWLSALHAFEPLIRSPFVSHQNSNEIFSIMNAPGEDLDLCDDSGVG